MEWSDQVGDRGAVTIDPGVVPVATMSGPTAPSYRRRRSIAAVAVAAVVVAVGAGLAWTRRTDSTFGIETLTFDQTTGTAVRSVTLAAGDVIRIRVEPSTRIDPSVLVVTSAEVARQQATFEAGDGQEADAFADRVYRSASEVFDDPDAIEAYRTSVVVDIIDSGSVGRPDAGWFTAYAAGEYRVVVAATVGRAAGPVRCVVERNEDRFLVGESDRTDFFSGPFFREPAFFDDAAPYAPAD